MNATGDPNPVAEAENEPLPPRLPTSNPVNLAAFKAWQKLPGVWLPPVAPPPDPDDFRDWGINE